MPDGHFRQKRQLSEHDEIIEIEIVACVDRQAKRVRKPRGFSVVRERAARGI